MKKIASIVTMNAFVIGLVLVYSLISTNGATAATRYTLQGSYIDAGYYGANGLSIPRNHYTPIGKPLSVNCPGPGGSCVIEADLFIQSGKSDVTGNQYNLCLFVDGASAPNCQIVGSTPADYSITNGSTSQQATVSPGAHVVQAVILSYKGTFVFNYTSNYRVFKP